jgi:hypothetical protein
MIAILIPWQVITQKRKALAADASGAVLNLPLMLLYSLQSAPLVSVM